MVMQDMCFISTNKQPMHANKQLVNSENSEVLKGYPFF